MNDPKYLDKSRLDEVWAVLSEQAELYAPLQTNAEEPPRLERYYAGKTVALVAKKPLLPMKTLFLPETERLFKFERSAGQTTVSQSPSRARKRVVFGALGCDIASLALLDKVFLAAPVDTAYRDRREQTTLIALSCSGEGPECFCSQTGVDPLQPNGADGVLTPSGDGFLFFALTDKGRQILTILTNILVDPTTDQRAAARDAAVLQRKDAFFAPLKGGWQPVWEADIWEVLAARCLSCGTCTALCPTCHCFDVQDEQLGDQGARFRAWDSCMATRFTLMAHGDNPRAKLLTRVRQRFMHKLSYFYDNLDAVACVGCGRCTRACPTGISIEDVFSFFKQAGEPHE